MPSCTALLMIQFFWAVMPFRPVNILCNSYCAFCHIQYIN